MHSIEALFPNYPLNNRSPAAAWVFGFWLLQTALLAGVSFGMQHLFFSLSVYPEYSVVHSISPARAHRT